MHIVWAGIFVLEAIGFFIVAAVHLGAALDVPGHVQPRLPVAAVAGLCGIALLGAAAASVKRRRTAWEIGLAAQVVCIAAMLGIDKVLAVSDVTPIYRIGIGVAAAVGIVLMTPKGKSVLGRESSDREG